MTEWLDETVPGIVASSYPSDGRLLEELRESWPPGPPAGDARGYTAVDLAGREPAAALRLGQRFAVALVAAPDGAYDVVPIARDETLVTSWRQTQPGDGLSALVAGVPVASERAIDADQTNTSVVVGERAIVKWFRRVGPGPSRAATLIAHLDAVDFPAIPPPLGAIAWRSPAGIDLVIAQGDGYLAGARDGWSWVVGRLERHVAHGAAACSADCDPWIGEPLGRLVAELHAALATPSALIATPRMETPPDVIADWYERARATLADAIALTAADDAAAGETLRALEPGMRTAIDRMRTGQPVATQPVHGDLHVGQVLEWPGETLRALEPGMRTALDRMRTGQPVATQPVTATSTSVRCSNGPAASP